MSIRAPFLTVVMALLTMSAANAATPEPGWFGLAYTVHAEGFLNPQVQSITVASVVPGSPAAQVHLGIGDEVLAVDDHTVSGTSGLAAVGCAAIAVLSPSSMQMTRPRLRLC